MWLEVGLQSNNTLRHISVNQLHTTLGDALCKALPAFHAFTGCDYTSSFSGKGKIKPFKVLEKNQDLQEAFHQIGSDIQVGENRYTSRRKHICKVGEVCLCNLWNEKDYFY